MMQRYGFLLVPSLLMTSYTGLPAWASGVGRTVIPYIGETAEAFEARRRQQELPHRTELRPYLGETAAEFEARKRGQAPPVRSDGSVVLKADGHGHFITVAQINGEDMKVMVDTGASVLALPYEDAERLGFRLKASDFTVPVNTANGRAKVAAVRVKEVRIGDVVVQDVAAAVSEPGALRITLLGMSFLKRLKSFQFYGDGMTLNQ
jgi:aspartyl protease family protein